LTVNIRLLLTFMVACLPFFTAFADNVDEIKAQINKVKKSSSYIYAESTAPTEADARSYAESKLYEEINAWVATQKKLKKSSNFVVNNRKELWTMLSMPRGSNMYRSFIYVKKKDIIPAENAVVIANESLPPVEESIQSQLPEVVSQIAACTKYGDMAEKIQQMKTEGKIKSYGRYASLSNPDKCYLAIYNREGKVVAVLTPGPDRRNVKTNKPDGVKNYSGCGAIGFEL
jgi:hypothetical protein